MNCNVYYETWQLECCGTVFSIGDTVKWLVCKAEQIDTPINIGEIDYYYEAHSSDWENIFVLEGKVETIKILYEQYEYKQIENDGRLLIPVDGKLVDAECASGFEEKIDDMQASAYVVCLKDCVIRPAKSEEVTFS